jgi:hypothetical protein
MVRTLFLVTLLMSLVFVSGAASAQEKNDLTGIIGRTFVSDQAVASVTAADNILHSGSGITFGGELRAAADGLGNSRPDL